MNTNQINPPISERFRSCDTKDQINFKKKRESLSRIVKISLLLLFCGIPGTTYAQSLFWENVHGATNNLDEGHDVLWATGVCNECQNCSIGDVITVGETHPPSGDKDVYAIRTSVTGTVIWEQTIDVGGLNLDDAALAVKEDPTGDIVIVGYTESTSSITGVTSKDGFLLRLNCDGSYSANRTYTDYRTPADGDEMFYDVDFIAPGMFGQPCDYVVVGYAQHPTNGTSDALMARLDYTGGIIWGHIFNSGGLVGPANEVFYALDILSGGDIVAGGYQQINGEKNGMAIRVNSNTGFTVGPNRGTILWGVGNLQDDEVHSIIELNNPAEGGAVAVTGLRQNNQIFLGKIIGGNFATVGTVEFSIALPAQPAYGSYGIGTDIIEIQSPYPSQNVAQYDLAITGKGTYASTTNNDYDAFLITYRAPFVGPPPVAVINKRYGGSREDRSNAIAESPLGFLMSGRTLTDFESVNDAGDLYLLSTDRNGSTTCENTTLPNAIPMIQHSSLAEGTGSWGSLWGRDPVQANVDWGSQICTGPYNKAIPTPEHSADLSLADNDALMHSRGNPLVLNLAAGHEGTTASLYDYQGRLVTRENTTSGVLTLETSGLPQGLYLIRTEDGTSRRLLLTD